MVDLAKIRKKAKRGAPPPPAVPPPEEKLQAFLATAGQKRPGLVQEVAAAESGNQVELLTFILGDERYAIDIDGIVEIISARPVTRVPNAEQSVLGIVSLRGAIVTLIDVRSRLRQPRRNGAAAQIIVVHDGGGLAGFEVDRVLRPAKIDRAAIEPQPMVHPSEQSEAIVGVYHAVDSLTIVLDLAKLLG
jgi:purine-binding chemotaxis protein CheW